jgi:hypothetical protein
MREFTLAEIIIGILALISLILILRKQYYEKYGRKR